MQMYPWAYMYPRLGIPGLNSFKLFFLMQGYKAFQCAGLTAPCSSFEICNNSNGAGDLPRLN